jgi:hypothetical protein
MSIGGGYYRRWFGNQTFTDDLRFGPSDYDGPFCINAPSNANLPGGGNYPVCGLYDLKPSVFAAQRVPDNLIRYSDDFGGETNLYQGFDVNLESRFANGAFVRLGAGAQARTFDNCNLLAAGPDANIGLGATIGTEVYEDGTTYCHREYPLRPDFKILGSYTLPGDVLLSGTYQYTRGIQTGGAGPSILANWSIASPLFAPNGGIGSTLGRALNPGSPTKSVQLMREGLEYGDQNLSQLDLRASKRFSFDRYRLRFDVDLYNVFNSNWPYTQNLTFSTSATAATWLRPTNVLQGRLFKIGSQFDF